MSRILVLNGPNLNLLGSREPEIYGHPTLEDIHKELQKVALELEVELDFYQSNAEHELIERIHEAPRSGVGFIIINPAAFTHTSVALRDALLGVGIPFIELHLSNVHARESFRAHSHLSDIASGIIMGLGADGYRLAFSAAVNKLANKHF